MIVRTLITITILLVALTAVRVSNAAFSDTVNNPQSISAAPDFIAPTISAVTVRKSAGGDPGYVRPGGTFSVYAAVSDSGNPASGVASVSADSSLFDMSGPASLSAQATTIDTVTYTHASGLRTTKTVTDGTYALALTATDQAANPPSITTTPTVTVDGTAPSIPTSGVATTSAGSPGLPSAGDTIRLTSSEPLDRDSVKTGWDGTATTTTVTFTNNAATDTISFPGTRLGVIAADRDYTTTGATFSATLTRSAALLTITLGALQSGSVITSSLKRDLTWTPGAGLTDRAGNTLPATARTEQDNDVDF